MGSFSISRELALPTKPMELDTDRASWKWVGCDCSAASPCFSRSRCDALATHRRVPSVPLSLRMPDLPSTRAMVRWMGTNEPFMVDAITSILRNACATPGAPGSVAWNWSRVAEIRPAVPEGGIDEDKLFDEETLGELQHIYLNDAQSTRPTSSTAVRRRSACSYRPSSSARTPTARASSRAASTSSIT